MFCKATLERIGRAAYNALSADDKAKYTTASGIISVITGAVLSGNITGAVSQIGVEALKVGESMAANEVIYLSGILTGKKVNDLEIAVVNLVNYFKNQLGALLDQSKHDAANKLAILFGVKENPGVLGAIMEWVYKSIIQPTLQAV